MRTTYQNTSMRFGVFRACAFRAKNPNVMGFSGSVNGTTKNPGFFFGFRFLPNVNGPIEITRKVEENMFMLR